VQLLGALARASTRTLDGLDGIHGLFQTRWATILGLAVLAAWATRRFGNTDLIALGAALWIPQTRSEVQGGTVAITQTMDTYSHLLDDVDDDEVGGLDNAFG
jgi:hypothetical protein